MLTYDLSDVDLNTIGSIIVECSHIEFITDCILEVLWNQNGEAPIDPPRTISRKIKELKGLMRAGYAPHIKEIVVEYRYAMAKFLPARNMLAHGILLFGEGDEKSYWSQSRLVEMPLVEVLAAKAWSHYALHCALHCVWALNGITPAKPLPKRP